MKIPLTIEPITASGLTPDLFAIRPANKQPNTIIKIAIKVIYTMPSLDSENC